MNDESAFRERLESIYKNLPGLSPTEILEIPGPAGPDEIRKNYYRLAKEFHPDRVLQVTDPELKKKITIVFNAITQAYQTLKNGAGHGKEKEHPATSAEAENSSSEESLLQDQFRRAIDEFRNGNFWGSAELFRFVTRRSPANAKAWNYLSRALAEIPKRAKEAEESLLEALKLDPYNSDFYTDLGCLYLRTGLKLRAKSQFEKALKLNSRNDRAKQELEKILREKK